MKKHLKSIISLLLAFVLFATALPLSEISASAAEKLSSSVTYKKDGTAVVELKAGDFYNAVRYTTDGSVPTKKSKYYFMPFEVTEKTLIRVAEFDGDEKVAGIKFTVDPENGSDKSDKKPASSATTTTTATPSASASTEKTGKVTFEVTQLGDYKAVVEIECETPGCEIRYTTDGSKPDENSKLYEDGIIVTEKTRIRARAYKEGYKTATTYAKTVNVKLFADSESTPIQTNVPEKTETEKTPAVTEPEQEETKQEEEKKPEVSVPAEKVYDDQKIAYKVTYLDNGTSRVTLTPAKSGYTIRYTTDGSTPTYKTGKKCKSYIILDEPTVLRARQYNSKGQCMGTLKLNVKIKCADVIYNCVSMETGLREIEMYCATPGATIYYTTNGENPRFGDAKVYTEPVFASSMSDVMAYATKEGYKDGAITWEIAGNIQMQLTHFDFSDHQYTLGADTVNSYRRANGLNELKLDENLTKAANLRAYELSVNYSNTRPSGKKYSSVLSQYNIASVFSVEFIERHHDNARDFINDVLVNETNKDRILSNSFEYTKLGIGYYETKSTTYWVLLMIDD